MTLSHPGRVTVTQADAYACQAEAFGKALSAEQAQSYGCGGVIECTFKMDGNCHCFNVTLARHAQQAREAERERCAAIALERSEGRIRLYEENGASINAFKAVEAEEIAAAIRALPEPAQRSRSTGNEQGNASHA